MELHDPNWQRSKLQSCSEYGETSRVSSKTSIAESAAVVRQLGVLGHCILVGDIL